MKLLIDMNLSPRWVRVLRAAGLDALRSEVGQSAASDGQRGAKLDDR